MNKVAIAVFAFIAAVAAQEYQQPRQAYQEPAYAPAKYQFNWAVKDDPSYNNYGQTESREADNTQGSYFVQLPDGRLQTVTYYVNGDSGYVAEVSYSGEAKYEASNNKPVYKQAPAAYKAAPAPTQYKPAPAQYKPAPAQYKQAPAQYKPAPAQYKPAPPAEYQPAPAEEEEYQQQ